MLPGLDPGLVGGSDVAAEIESNIGLGISSICSSSVCIPASSSASGLFPDDWLGESSVMAEIDCAGGIGGISGLVESDDDEDILAGFIPDSLSPDIQSEASRKSTANTSSSTSDAPMILGQLYT